MSIVSLLDVKVNNNPAKFTDSYEFEITFECLEQLEKDLEWKLTYVGSATSDQHDQELDSLLVGPIPVGVNKFIFEADPPDVKRIPDAEILGVTVILLTCAYDGREFVRVGYYVNNEYDLDELNAEPPAKPLVDHIRRNVLAEKPRVTRFAIKWDSEASAPAEFPPEQPEADLVADEDEYGADEAEDAEEDEDDAGPAAPDSAAEKAQTGDGAEGEDAAMAGAEPADAGEEDEMSDDGSVDIEGESEDEIEEEDDGEGDAGEGGEGAEGDEMDVDSDKPNAAGGDGHHPVEVMSH
ncbi:Histone deposition protein Asf1 [Niveomyces insectorum RCEF 264]|uniref:Histone chaperone n=1 Tax=Niveomyces insectorum RCEF 264 TaxID=1081102 RepID=A0A167MMM4_9HYPO|nr:Histone deposition protein Asf1 [Niveomyces insectorum RCEF 264]